MMPIKHAAQFLNGAAFKPSDWGNIGLPILRIAQLTGKPFDNYFDGTINRGLLIRDGDLLFSWSATIDAFIWKRGDAILNQHIFKVVPKKNAIREYLFYVIKAHAQRWADDDAHGSTMRHIKKESLSNKVWMPDIETQRSIAHFLDRETARIYRLIEKKQRFLNLLEEKREVAINSALNRGLQSGVPYRSSGVSSIGEIPAHWEVSKLGYIGRCANGINIAGDAFGSGFPFVSYRDVYKHAQLPKNIVGLVKSSTDDRMRYSLKSGDVLFTRTSETIDEIGYSSVCLEDVPNAVYAGFLIRFRPFKGKLVPNYSKFWFRNQALRAFFSKEMMIVTRASLSQDLLQKLPVLLPPLSEQREIAEYLQDVEIKHISVAEMIRKSIEGLREFRSALITAAVTGQIDVTTWRKQGCTERHLDHVGEEIPA